MALGKGKRNTSNSTHGRKSRVDVDGAAAHPGSGASSRSSSPGSVSDSGSDLASLVHSLMKRVQLLEADNERLNKLNDLYEGRIDRLEVKNSQLKERLVDGEERMMSRNLVFTNVAQQKDEDCAKVAKKLFKDKLSGCHRFCLHEKRMRTCDT